MSDPLRIALLADGASDRALLNVIRWIVVRHLGGEFAQPNFCKRTVSRPILDEMRRTMELYEPDVLFVHRDAENEDPEVRRREIPDIEGVLVRVVPVRMTEAWLLFDEGAIRRAAGNPRGVIALDLPSLNRTERLADPKANLHGAILTAAEVTGRRRHRMQRDLPAAVQRVAELITDFSPLIQLRAFQTFQQECLSAVRAL